MWLPSAHQIEMKPNDNYLKSFWLAFYGSGVSFCSQMLILVLVPFMAKLVGAALILWSAVTNLIANIFAVCFATWRMFIYGISGYLCTRNVSAEERMKELGIEQNDE